MKTAQRAKLFQNGRSQAVRLPKQFRMPGTEVLVHQEGDAVILEPIRAAKWPAGYWERLAELRSEFEAPPLAIQLEVVEPDRR